MLICQLLRTTRESSFPSFALQIRCGAVKAVPGGFDSHALPPLAAQKTPGLCSGVFYLAGNIRSIIDMLLSSAGTNKCQITLNTVFDNHIQLIKYCKELVCVSGNYFTSLIPHVEIFVGESIVLYQSSKRNRSLVCQYVS
jgi:hypothetical protein